MQMRNSETVNEDIDWSTKAPKSEKDLSIGLNEIAAQAYLFFIKGFETSASTMSFGMHELAKNQEIQNKVYEEIKTVLERYDKKITYESIKEMKYLDKFIDV